MGNSVDHTDWNPGTLLQLSGSYWQTFTLHTGVKLGVFSLLAEAPLEAGVLAERLKLDRRGATMLLNALAAMDLLCKSGERFDVTDASRRFLNQSSPQYIGYMIMHHHHLAEPWSRLDEAVRSGQPLRTRASSSEDTREAFLMGMYNIASQQAPAIARLVEIGPRKHLLDLGGGPGTYAIHFCQQNPDLQGVVFDLPTTRPFAEKTIDRHGMSDRIQFLEGNFIKDAVGGPYDVAWISHILHAESRANCRQMISKVVRALRPGGIILIHDFILNDTMDGPLFPALFALNMLQGTEQGQSYCQADITQMLEEAGVTGIRRLTYQGPTQSAIIQGMRA